MDDDEVARLLTKEALENSNKYLTDGLGAYRTSRPPGNAPKPNTRFLRHLIKETDSHNTALRNKEERETRERMRALRLQSETPQLQKSHSRRSDRPSTRDPEKRDRHDRDGKPRSRRHRTRSRSPPLDNDNSKRYRDRGERDRHGRKDERSSHRERQRDHSSSRKDRRERRRSYSRSRSRSPRRERSSKSTSYRSTRDSTHRSRRDPSSRSHRPSRLEDTGQSTPNSTSTGTVKEENRKSAYDSDPLEEFVGPLPPTTSSAPILPRGRGAYRAQVSNIDAHFAADYDPALDVQPDEDEDTTTKASSRRHVPGLMTREDDWDTALEALRDRTRWRQKGEERLRAAGINEGAIDRWKNYSTSTGADQERRPEDVQWSKKGEGREWDRGKFVDDQGHIDVRAQWSM